MMFKRFSLIMAFAVCICLLSGCGTLETMDGAKSGSTESSGTAKTTAKAMEAKKTGATSKATTVVTTKVERSIDFTSGLTFHRNEMATLSIKGKPNTAYSISVYYSTAESVAKGLERKTSDAQGNVSWTWKIGGRTKPGKFRVEIIGGGEKITEYITVVVE